MDNGTRTVIDTRNRIFPIILSLVLSALHVQGQQHRASAQRW